MAVDTGRGHWVEGITLSSGILMTAFCHRSVSSTFAPRSPSSLSIAIHFSTSSSFTLFVTRNRLFHPSPPRRTSHLCPLTMSSATYSHAIERSRKHTLRRSVPLSSPRLSCSLFHSLTHPVVFFNGGFCPFHLLGNKGFLSAQDRGKERDGEPDREEEILTLSGKSHFTREGIHHYNCQGDWYTFQILFRLH